MSPQEMSQCIGSVENGTCMCKFVVTHFSTFAVGDSDVLDSASPVLPPPPSQNSPDVIAVVAGGVVGGIAFVIIVAFVIVEMKKRYQSSAKIQPFSFEAIQQGVHGVIAGCNATAQGNTQLTSPQTEFQLAITCFQLPNLNNGKLETQP
jgi:hypothetical protein